MGVADIMTNVMKVMRLQLNNIYAPFSSMMKKFWNKFKEIGTLSSRIFQHLYMSMKKAAATATASLFVALSLQTAVLNGIDLVINVIMIMLYILLALAIIFFLPILPVIVFVSMAVSGIEAGFPGRTGGMGDVFCFAPDTQVIMNNRTTKPIQSMALGDILLDGQRVEAVIEIPGTDRMYTIYGVHVSGDHRIWYEHCKSWILVKNHPDAVPYTPIHILWTLITSNRIIPVRGSNPEIPVSFSDWEELPDTDASAKLWDSIVYEILNGETIPKDTMPKDTIPPKYPPCFDGTIQVQKYFSGLVPLSSIKRGDLIMGDKEWTRVIGICNRRVKGYLYSFSDKITDGVWIKVANSTKWEHISSGNILSKRESWNGYNLITESGTFKITMTNEAEYIVRDFTEVGFRNLTATYTRVESAMCQN
jgi:hypothetical protein